jgi:uncharacterized repeat protein (TIGR01451 family)
MIRLKSAVALVALFAAFGTAAASARPNVSLQLDGKVIERDAKGAEKLVPVTSDTGFKPGETVRYVIVASNRGSSAALNLMPEGKIPAGTAYEAGTASLAAAARVEFSIDGGKTWAAKPLIKVATANGTVEKAADPSLYTMLRWVASGALAPKASVSYSYQVRIK